MAPSNISFLWLAVIHKQNFEAFLFTETNMTILGRSPLTDIIQSHEERKEFEY